MIPEIAKWTLVALFALSAVLNVMFVGKPRRPTTGGVAATIVVINSLAIAAILTWWQ